MPVRLTPDAGDVFWVQITTATNLDKAYRLLCSLDGQVPPLLIIASREENNADRFLIVLEDFFHKKDAAREAIATLPRTLSTGAKVLPGLDKQRVYIR